MKKKLIIILSFYFAIIYIYGQNVSKGSIDIGLIPNIENKRDIVIMFANKSLDTITACCDNEKAIRIFERRMDIIRQYQVDKSNIDISLIADIIFNLELLTNIESESDGNYFGKYKPTDNDITMWREWFQKYKHKICWYEEKRILYIKE